MGRLAMTAVATGMLVVFPGRAAAQEIDCLMCHENPAFWESRDDGDRFVVTREALEESVHGRLRCVDCHEGLTFPHPDDRQPANCGRCHGTQRNQHNQSLHGLAARRGDPLAPSCASCHGTHDVRASTEPGSQTSVMNIPFLCGECHQEGTEVSLTRDIPQDRVLENYSMSIHGTGLFRQGLTVTAVCTSCHTSHLILPHTDERSSIHVDNVVGTCMQCHGRIEEVHLQFIEGRLWEEEPHKIPACVDCHQPHKIRRVFYDAGVANQDCLECHGDPEFVVDDGIQSRSLYVDVATHEASTHAETPCSQCHVQVTPIFDERPCETVDEAVDCSICHPVQVEEFGASSHGMLRAEGDFDAPTCNDCHQRHSVTEQTNPASPTYPRNVPELCARCHNAGEPAARRIQRTGPDIVLGYEMSIHGKGLLESGLVVTATCTDCHGAHTELPASEAAARINPNNVASTCGECHHGIEEQFRESVHWPEDGNFENAGGEHSYPTCEDCHTSHTISRTDRDDFRMLMMSQCGRCHEEESETFFDTYHGKVSRVGGASAAKCYDCHGTHNILPTNEPASTLSRRNIVETCAQCHSGANRRFTGYLTHATHHDPERYPWLFWTFWFMASLLIGTLTVATLHTAAWLWRLWRSPEDWKHEHEPVDPSAEPQPEYRRFTKFQRSLHGVMMVSFMLLAATGMALKFSHMGWAQAFAWILGGFEAMGVWHRLGAVALFTVFFIHLFDARKQKIRAGQTWLQFITSRDSLVFNKYDVAEFAGSIRWFLGRGPRPQYGRYTYWEKFDYFAVFWGMFVIGSTGFLLWFPELFTVVLPGWLVNVATIIHSDEALLAVAFIFTIHFFNTHFRLDKFPMDPVIFTGRVPVEELKRDKPREYERMVASGEFEKRLVPPYPRRVEMIFRIIGFTMLGTGIIIILHIVYSALFGYR
jgi:cytochrome b subunit of formate dehydrogenase